MGQFEIGWVPAGWTRGEDLFVSRAAVFKNGDRRMGYVAQAELPPYAGPNANVGAVAQVRFTIESAPAVDAWLRWWYAA